MSVQVLQYLALQLWIRSELIRCPVSISSFLISQLAWLKLHSMQWKSLHLPAATPNSKSSTCKNIELPSDSVDVVGCMFGYFVPDRLKAFSEVCRVCRPGGIAVIGTWKYAGLAYVFADFLTFLGAANSHQYDSSLQIAHVCADGDTLRAELVSLGFSEVTVHEQSHMFDIPLHGDKLVALLGNPMIKTHLDAYPPETVLSEWARFARQPGLQFEVDLERDALLVRYTANIAVAVK